MSSNVRFCAVCKKVDDPDARPPMIEPWVLQSPTYTIRINLCAEHREPIEKLGERGEVVAGGIPEFPAAELVRYATRG